MVLCGGEIEMINGNLTPLTKEQTGEITLKQWNEWYSQLKTVDDRWRDQIIYRYKGYTLQHFIQYEEDVVKQWVHISKGKIDIGAIGEYFRNPLDDAIVYIEFVLLKRKKQ